MPTRPLKFQFLPFAVCIIISLAAGAIGGLFTQHSVDTWYKTINKPSFTPPDGLFSPVWITLYILIGISSYLIWQRRKRVTGYAWAVIIYHLQLVLNILWSYFFFYQQQLGFAVIEIGVLLVAIIINAFIFYRINKVAGLLYIPYILWVGFAAYLTYSIFILN